MATVLLTRHADIDLPSVSPDPGLNAAGIERAKLLANTLSAARVDAVFTSSFLRTKQTAAPLATLLRLQPRKVPPPPNLAQQVRAGGLGEVVLVVGHSNTVPEMIAALGVSRPPPAIGEHEFDNLFVVTVAAAGGAYLVTLKYGRTPDR